jgi:hypothetical protein
MALDYVEYPEALYLIELCMAAHREQCPPGVGQEPDWGLFMTPGRVEPPASQAWLGLIGMVVVDSRIYLAGKHLPTSKKHHLIPMPPERWTTTTRVQGSGRAKFRVTLRAEGSSRRFPEISFLSPLEARIFTDYLEAHRPELPEQMDSLWKPPSRPDDSLQLVQRLADVAERRRQAAEHFGDL